MYRSIALGGGGIRGGLLIGGLDALSKEQPLEFPDGIYGCSVGSIIAVAVAFGLTIDQMKECFKENLKLETYIPSWRQATFTSFAKLKGLFSMDFFEEAIVQLFLKRGLDLRGKVIADAPQKLYIVASNLTTHKAAFLTGQVPILQAIKCSCCLPLVFHPQMLYNNVYVDGGIYAHNLYELLPKDCLNFHISRSELNMTSKHVEELSIATYLSNMYEAARTTDMPENVVLFKKDDVGVLQDITTKDMEKMYRQGHDIVSRFLAKRSPKKVDEVVVGDGLVEIMES